jgi:glycosyltransferase involved in cell wall biosynthesis
MEANSALNLEIIIVVDSPDTDFNLLCQPYINGQRISYVFIRNSKNLGVAASRNKGFEISNGDFLLFIDQDDEISKNFFLEFLKNTNKDLIVVNALLITPKNHFLWFYITPKINLYNLIMKSLIRSPGQVILKRTHFPKEGFPLPKTNFGSDDKFFWIKLFCQFPKMKIKYIHKPLYRAYLHEQNFSNNWRELANSSLELWKTINTDVSIKLQELKIKDTKQLKFILGYKLSFWDMVSARIIYASNRYTLNNALRFFLKKLF